MKIYLDGNKVLSSNYYDIWLLRELTICLRRVNNNINTIPGKIYVIDDIKTETEI